MELGVTPQNVTPFWDIILIFLMIQKRNLIELVKHSACQGEIVWVFAYEDIVIIKKTIILT
jgi:hypothetical protein